MSIEELGDLVLAHVGHGTLTCPKSDNIHRAALAAVAVYAFAGRVNSSDTDEALGDLLGDVRHLCDHLDMDADELWARGRRYYLLEIEEAQFS